MHRIIVGTKNLKKLVEVAGKPNNFIKAPANPPMLAAMITSRYGFSFIFSFYLCMYITFFVFV